MRTILDTTPGYPALKGPFRAYLFGRNTIDFKEFFCIDIIPHLLYIYTIAASAGLLTFFSGGVNMGLTV
jgi:hypothetical protein